MLERLHGFAADILSLEGLLDVLLVGPALMTPPDFSGLPDGSSPEEWRATAKTFIGDYARAVLAPAR